MGRNFISRTVPVKSVKHLIFVRELQEFLTLNSTIHFKVLQKTYKVTLKLLHLNPPVIKQLGVRSTGACS